MLSPHEIAELPEAIQEIWNDFEEEILVDIAQRIIHNDEVTATAQWRYAKLKELGLQDSYIFEKLVHYANKSEKELKKLFRDTIAESLEKDNEYYAEALKQEKKKLDFQSFNEIANQGYKFTNNKIQNFTNSYAYDAKEALGKALDRIYFEVDTGVKSLDEAQKDAIDDLAKKGIGAFIVSPSGRNEQVSVVVSRAVRTGLNKTASDCQLQLATELGCDLVEVTSHQGARPSHDLWQGKVYSISGTHSKYPSLHAATRYGYGDGLCGWNCRHSFFPFFEDISEPNERTFTKSENLAVYEYRQKKKAIENEIRKNMLSMKIKKAAGMDYSDNKKKLKSIRKSIKELGEKAKELKSENYDHFYLNIQFFGTKKIKPNKNQTMFELANNNFEHSISLGEMNDYGVIKNKLFTKEVIVTNERMLHILDHHPELEKITYNDIKNILDLPNAILKDKMNKKSFIFTKEIDKNHSLGLVVRILDNSSQFKYGKKNTVITCFKVETKRVKESDNLLIYVKK